ncbi:transposase family protein [Streptomyces sp. NPDC096030]|uniref:transposase family protein n=1 Tax=Streptomyces sp. NPDC096030 TaxID=3155423 RepID=UPI00331B9DD5
MHATEPRSPGGQGLPGRRRDRHHPDQAPAERRTARQHKTSNKVHAALRAPVERTISRIKQWQLFRHARISPNRLTSAAAAILTLTIYT